MKNRWTLTAVAAVIVICIASTLWFATPARAMTVVVTAPPSGTRGQTISFTATVNVQTSDLLPINRIDLQIYNTSDPAISVTCGSLPLPQGSNQTKSQTFTNSGGTSTFQ